MKRVIALLLTAVMLLSLAACSSGGAETTTAPKTTTEPQKTTEAETTEAPAQTDPQESTEAPTDDLPGELVETTFWSLRYDPEVWVWEYEEALYDSDYESSLYLMIPDPEDPEYGLTYFSVYARETDHENFRSNLRDNGFDEYEYAVNNAYDTVNVGGLEFLVNDSDDDYTFYFMRSVSAGIDVEITVRGEVTNEAVAGLLEALTFTIPDGDNVDAPWYWDGEPYAVDPGDETIGAFTLNSVQIPFAAPIVTHETFDHNIASVGNVVYVINDGAIHVYGYDGSKLDMLLDMSLEEEYTIADASVGNVWFSSFMENLLCFDGQAYTAAFEGTDKVSMCPTAPWGISWFSDSTIMKLLFDGAAVTAYEYTLAEVDSISHLCVDGNGNIYVCGSDASDGDHKVFVYNENLELQVVLAAEDGSGIGSAVFATQTANGYLVLDGNMRDVILYQADGTYIGCCDFSDLFGTDYPWPCDACVMEDGSILVIMTDERPDESADELIVFKLTGF